MTPESHARELMLPHLLHWIATDRDYAKEAIPAYFRLCPWADALIGAQLREAWRDPRSNSELG